MMSLAAGRAATHTQADLDLDYNMSRSPTEDGGHQEIDEERLLAQRNMQMLDLGTGRREYVTTCDKPLPRELRLSKQQLLRARKVEEEGTDAAKLFQENRAQVNAWNNIGTQIAQDNADREQLDDLMGGQSHRARLNKEIKERGGQSYGELSNVQIGDYPRRGRGDGVGGRGIPGRSGRGAPMHVPITRTNGRGPAIATPSVPTGPKADRPLDPAIDPGREYAYKCKRGGKTFNKSYGDGQATQVGPTLGREKTANDARATMVGTTVRIGPAAQSKPNSENSEPPQAPRMAPVTVVLDDQAFLKVMNSMPTKPTFNEHVQAKSKPAPSSKAAALVEQAAEATKKPAAVTNKTGSAVAKSVETPVEAYRKLEARNKPSNADGNIRLAPTHEFAFPPPITRSGGKNVQDGSVSVHTDGVESATTFDSADFATQSSRDAQAQLSRNHGTIIISSNAAQKNWATKSAAKPEADDLGINVLPPASHAEAMQKGDLIVLDEGSGQSQPGAKAFSNNAPTTSTANPVQSPGIPDIMDEDLDVDIPQSSLTPRSSVVPRCVNYRGKRYIRADQITSQDIENRPQANGQQDNRQQGTRPYLQIESPNLGLPNRIVVTSGLNIGLQTLRESSAGSNLGEHNPPGRSRGSTEASSNPSFGASRLAMGMFRPAVPVARPQQSLLSQIRLNSTLPQQPHQHFGTIQGAQRRDTEMTDAFATSSAQQKVAPVSSLAASKHAPPGARVVITQQPVGSARPSSIDWVHKVTIPISTAPKIRQDKFVATSPSPDNNRNMYSSTLLRTGSLQADNPTITVPKPPSKPSNLAASRWGNPNSEVKTLAQSNKNFGDETRQPGFKLAPVDGVNGEGDPVVESQDGLHRKRNPFGTVAQSSQLAAIEDDINLPSMVPTQPAGAPMMSERSGNIPSATHTPLTISERLANTGLSSFKFSEPTSSTSTKLIASKGANGAIQGPSSGSQISRNKPKPTGNLMASKYAPTNASSASNTSFRKVRLRSDSSSDESEI